VALYNQIAQMTDKQELETKKKEDTALYLQLKKFTGDPDGIRCTRFDRWKADFELAIRKDVWPEAEIIRKLRLKLSDNASEAFDSFALSNPEEAKT